MNNYVYYDSFSAITAWERWRPALARATAILVEPPIGGDRQKFPNSPTSVYWHLLDAPGRPR